MKSLSDYYHLIKHKVSINNTLNRLRCFFVSHMRKKTFLLHGTQYPYLNHVYNHSWGNERSAEVPVVQKIVADCSGSILEIGNVLSHYSLTHHEVVDKYERSPGVFNEDAVDFKAKTLYDLIVSISTFEHIGFDEEVKEPRKPLRAIENLLSYLTENGKMVITIPIGYNKDLDDILRRGEIPFAERQCLKRISYFNEWREATWDEVSSLRFGKPYSNANGLVFLTFRRRI